MTVIASLFSLLTSSIIFSKALGTSTMFIAAKNKSNLFILSIAVTFFTTIGSMLAYVADTFILKENSYYQPLVYVVIISIVYVGTLLIVRVLSEDIFISLKKYIHVSAFNCAVIGALLLNDAESTSFSDYVMFGFKIGLGFIAAAFMLKLAYNKINSPEVPKSFRGYPILLIYIGIISMALYSIKI